MHAWLRWYLGVDDEEVRGISRMVSVRRLEAARVRVKEVCGVDIMEE